MLVLNIQSSPRGAKSASIAVTNAFLDAYQVLHSDATIDTLNVWEENLPDFDSEAIGMVQRSDPVPTPPPLVADEGLTFVLPVIFRKNGKAGKG